MELLVLRLVHVLGGILWVGAAVFNAFFLGPALGKAGPAAGPVMSALRARGLFTFMPVVALLTLASGTRLMQIMSNGFEASWFQSTRGSAYAWSGLAAIVAFVIGLAVLRPLATRMGRLAGQLAGTTDETARAALQARITAAQRWSAPVGGAVTLLLLVSAAGMSVARYLT